VWTNPEYRVTATGQAQTLYPRSAAWREGVQEYDGIVSRWKPSRRILVVLVVLHIIVTAITLRDLGRRTDTQVRGSRLFWRVFTPLQIGNSAVYWLVGRRRNSEPTEHREAFRLAD
jgi:hypothetical protein